MTDALSGLDKPADARTGDLIVHYALPGYPMTVHAVRPCETSGPRSEPHSSYEVTDPEGNQDWLCGWDVRKVTR